MLKHLISFYYLGIKHFAKYNKINLSYYIPLLLFIVKDYLYLKGLEELNYRLSIILQNSQDRLLKRLIILKLNRSLEVRTKSSPFKKLPRLGSLECFLIYS